MAIHILKGLHKWHKTPQESTVEVSYIMSKLDFDRGWGDFYYDSNIYLYTMQLPQIGTNYLDFYGFVEDEFNALYNGARDMCCVDIMEEPQVGNELWVDSLGLDRQNIRQIKYTFSNLGRREEIIPDDWSNVRDQITTSLEISNPDMYFEFESTTAKYFALEYFTLKNPTIYFYGTDSNGKPTIETIGAFSSQSDAWKKYYIDNNPAPPTRTDIVHVLLTIKFYTRINYDYSINELVNSINFSDLLTGIREKRNEALGRKGSKIPEYGTLEQSDDSKKWKFNNVKREDYSNSVFEYTMEFEYKPDGWDKEFGVTTNKYKVFDFISYLDQIFLNDN